MREGRRRLLATLPGEPSVLEVGLAGSALKCTLPARVSQTASWKVSAPVWNAQHPHLCRCAEHLQMCSSYWQGAQAQAWLPGLKPSQPHVFCGTLMLAFCGCQRCSHKWPVSSVVSMWSGDGRPRVLWILPIFQVLFFWVHQSPSNKVFITSQSWFLGLQLKTQTLPFRNQETSYKNLNFRFILGENRKSTFRPMCPSRKPRDGSSWPKQVGWLTTTGMLNFHSSGGEKSKTCQGHAVLLWHL